MGAVGAGPAAPFGHGQRPASITMVAPATCRIHAASTCRIRRGLNSPCPIKVVNVCYRKLQLLSFWCNGQGQSTTFLLCALQGSNEIRLNAEVLQTVQSMSDTYIAIQCAHCMTIVAMIPFSLRSHDSSLHDADVVTQLLPGVITRQFVVEELGNSWRANQPPRGQAQPW